MTGSHLNDSGDLFTTLYQRGSEVLPPLSTDSSVQTRLSGTSCATPAGKGASTLQKWATLGLFLRGSEADRCPGSYGLHGPCGRCLLSAVHPTCHSSTGRIGASSLSDSLQNETPFCASSLALQCFWQDGRSGCEVEPTWV